MLKRFSVKTKGHTDIINLTGQVANIVQSSEIEDGLAIIFVAHSTAAITTIEYESGVIYDLKEALERIAPEEADYEHHKRWGDHNGAAHIKSAIIGPSLSVPIEAGQLILGTWQQIVLVDFDEKGRNREIIVRVTKE